MSAFLYNLNSIFSSFLILSLTLDLGVHVFSLAEEPDVLLAGCTVQISLLSLFQLQLIDSLLQPVQLCPV